MQIAWAQIDYRQIARFGNIRYGEHVPKRPLNRLSAGRGSSGGRERRSLLIVMDFKGLITKAPQSAPGDGRGRF